MKKNDAGNDEQKAFCPECNAPIEGDTQFCINCGASIQEPPSETESEPLSESVPEPPKEAALSEPMHAPTDYIPGSDMPFPDTPVPSDMTDYRKVATPQKSTNMFVSGFLGLIIFFALLCAVIVAAIFSPDFFGIRNMSNIFGQLLILGAVACGVAMTSRAKGPDLSMGAVVAITGIIISAIGGSWILGLVVALLVCASIGAINGILIVFLRVPALIMTIVVSAILRAVVFLASSGRINRVSSSIVLVTKLEVGGVQIIPIAIFAVAFVAAFFAILFSRLGKPLSKREVKDNRSASYFVAYMLSSIIAFMVGVFYVSRFGAASPVIGTGYEIFILFTFAIITSSRYLDNRGLPVVFAVAATLLYTILYALIYNGLNLRVASQYWLQLIVGAIALVFVIISYITRKDSLKGLIHRV